MNSTGSQLKTAHEENALTKILGLLTEHTNEIGSALDRLQRVPSRAFGARGEGDHNNGPKAVPGGTLGTIQEQIERLGVFASELRSVANEIDRIV